jgi:vacuolar-type H+-ATPase subunit H
MEYMELLNKIIEAEQLAQKIASEAKAKRDSLPDDLRAQTEALRKQYLDRAEHRVQAVADQEEKLADEQIALLEEALKADLSQVDRYFTTNHNDMVKNLFQLVVGQC